MNWLKKERSIRLRATHFAQDDIILKTSKGTEFLSTPFKYNLLFLTEKNKTHPTDLIKKNITIEINKKIINGFITSIKTVSHSETHTEYEATLSPWLSLLDLEKESRVFQHQSAPELFTKLCKEKNFHDFDCSKLTKTYQPIEYCIQYQETRFHFLSRLLEQAGIFYYFTHEASRHILHLADNACLRPTQTQPLHYSKNPYEPDRLHSWQSSARTHASEIVVKDYNPNHSQLELSAEITNPDHQTLGRTLKKFIFPGGFKTLDDAMKTAKRQAHINTWPAHTVTAKTTAPHLQAGHFINVTHPYESGRYLIISIESEIFQESLETIQTLTLLHEKHSFAPQQIHKKPHMSGSFPATVVGPKNKWLYANKQGCIKIQFPWDTENKYNEHSSCWIRTVQTQAGSESGTQFYPEIGSEVSVQFLHGNPDYPIVVASYPKAKQKPLFDPEHCRGIKTHTGHTVLFDDTPAKETLTIQSSGDLKISADKKLSTTVQGDSKINVNGDYHVTAEQGSINLNANTLEFRVGTSRIVLGADGVLIEAGSVEGLPENIHRSP